MIIPKHSVNLTVDEFILFSELLMWDNLLLNNT